jgi:ribonuclease HI
MITLYTDGSSTQNGSENAIGGAGIWHEEESLFNRAMRIPGKGVTNQKAELIAIMEAVAMNRTASMLIKSDSKTTLEGIIKYLKNGRIQTG